MSVGSFRFSKNRRKKDLDLAVLKVFGPKAARRAATSASRSAVDSGTPCATPSPTPLVREEPRARARPPGPPRLARAVSSFSC
jgi:hypothetical protein